MSTIADLLIKLKVDDKDAEAKLNGFGGKAHSAIRKGLVPAIAVLGAAGVAANRMASDASNLGESQNAVNVVFGKASRIVGSFAKGAARQAGLSMRQANEMIVPIGASLRNYGYSSQEAAKQSVALAKRAADMASVFNTSVPEALAAIQAGLRGEADPLEKFGVGLSASAVKAKAMSMGLVDAKGNLSKHNEMLARNAVIMDQTNRYAGDFVRTSGQAANKARINAAEAENLSASYGGGLLPVLKMLRSAMGTVLSLMAKHTTTTKVLVGVVSGLAAAVIVLNAGLRVKAAVMALASAATAIHTRMTAASTTATASQIIAQNGLNASMRANVIFLVVSALAALVAGLIYAWKNSETFRAIVTAAFDGVKAAAVAVGNFVTEKIPAAFQKVKDWMSENWPEIATIISGPFAPLVALATNAFGIRSRFQSAMTSVRNWAKARIDDIVGFMRSLPGRLVGLAQSAGSAVLNGLGRGLSALGSRLVGWIIAPIRAVIGRVNSAIGAINGALTFSIDTHVPGVGKIGSSVNIPKIPMLAKGGIVTGPTLAMIGEGAHHEAVVPLDGRHSLGGNITVVVEDRTMAGMSPEQRRSLARQLGPELRAAVSLGV